MSARYCEDCRWCAVTDRKDRTYNYKCTNPKIIIKKKSAAENVARQFEERELPYCSTQRAGEWWSWYVIRDIDFRCGRVGRLWEPREQCDSV